MPDQLDGSSVAIIFAFFFAVVLVRTQATYWLARAVATQALTRITPRSRLMTKAQRWSAKDSVQYGMRLINSWGVIAVTLSFFAFGLKTVVNGAAGLTRMPFGRYLPAMLLGCLIHATIYATVGAAAWGAALSALAGSPWGALGLLAVVAVVVLAGRRVGQRVRSRANEVDPSQSCDSPTQN